MGNKLDEETRKKALRLMSDAPVSSAENPINVVQILLKKIQAWFNLDAPDPGLNYPNNLVFIVSANAEKKAKLNSLEKYKFFFDEAVPPPNNCCVLIGSSVDIPWRIIENFVSLSALYQILKGKKLDELYSIVIQPNRQKILFFPRGLKEGHSSQTIKFSDLKEKDLPQSFNGKSFCLKELKSFHNNNTSGGHRRRYWVHKGKYVVRSGLEGIIQKDLEIWFIRAKEQYGFSLTAEPQIPEGKCDLWVVFPSQLNQNTAIELKTIYDFSAQKRKFDKDDFFKTTTKYGSAHHKKWIMEGVEQIHGYKIGTLSNYGILSVYNACKDEKNVLQKEIEAELASRNLDLAWFRMFYDLKESQKEKNKELLSS